MRIRPVRFAADVVELYFSKNVSRAAAELAYFLILTVFPILICVSAFVARLDVDLEGILRGTDKLLPAGVNAVLEEYVRYLETSRGPAMLIVGAASTVLFASAAVRGLMNIMQEIYGRATFRGVTQVVASVVFSLLLLLSIYLSLVVLMTGNWFFGRIEAMFHLEGLIERFGTWQWLKYLILLGVVFLFIWLLCRFTAPLARPRPPVLVGALGASAALVAASLIFSWFIGRSSRYSLVYGSRASVIILLVWLYLCGNILIMGNVVNYVLSRHRREKRELGSSGRENGK